jgi:toxin FitB
VGGILSKYILDTNVLSEPIKPVPSRNLLAWIASQDPENLFIEAWSMVEIQRGILAHSAGKKRTLLENWFGDLRTQFAGRILPFDERVAIVYAIMIGTQRSVRTPAALKRSQRDPDNGD